MLESSAAPAASRRYNRRVERNLQKVNIREKLASFSEHWSPRVAGELNGQHVKLVKLQGEFVWHHHQNEDELFLVISGSFRLDYRNARGSEHSLKVGEGEFVIVPRGVEHRPVADSEAHILLFEPAGTLNTGNVESAMTVKTPLKV
jgi:mannose-6-phosphate isomerase-like protein (cupin superfamily)